MNNEYLTDEDIHAFDEPSDEEKEIAKLKIRIVKNEERIEIEEYVLDKIVPIVSAEIRRNLQQTRMTSTTAAIKAYREELLFLRELEKLIKVYTNYKEKRE